VSDEIRVDYEGLEQVAARFATGAQNVGQTMQKVRSAMAPLESGGWIGRGSDAFFTEMNSEILPAVTRLQDVLEEASQTVREIVARMQQAEDEASSRFR
jgi:WXG100 family type VII secretion target